MALRSGFRAIVSTASGLGLATSCSAPYAPDLRFVPRTVDASSVAAPDDDQPADATASPIVIPPTGVFDASSLIGQPETDASTQRFGTDASLLPGNIDDSVDAAPRPAPDAGPPRPHAATIVVTTVDDLMCYSPENVGAIWIADSSGAFVETLQEWGKTRIDHLVLWNSATSDAGLPRNTVDAITAATAQSYGTRVSYWNFTNAMGTTVPDGSYRVYFETCDDNVPGPNTFVNFSKGPTPETFTFPDTTYFWDLKVIVMP